MPKIFCANPFLGNSKRSSEKLHPYCYLSLIKGGSGKTCVRKLVERDRSFYDFVFDREPRLHVETGTREAAITESAFDPVEDFCHQAAIQSLELLGRSSVLKNGIRYIATVLRPDILKRLLMSIHHSTD